MATMKYEFSVPEKNFKAEIIYDSMESSTCRMTIGRRTVVLERAEINELLGWLNTRLEGRDTENTLKIDSRPISERNSPIPEETDTVADEARKGIIDMSPRLAGKKTLKIKVA